MLAPAARSWQKSERAVVGDRPLKVVLATDSVEPSGMGEHMLALAGVLGPGVEAVLALPSAASVADLARRASLAGLRVRRFEPEGGGLEAWLRGARPDLVHVHAGIGWEGHRLVRDAAACGLPVIRTEHLPYLLTDPDQIEDHRRMLGEVARLVTVSDAAARSFLEAGVAPSVLATIRNGIIPKPAREPRAKTLETLDLAGDAPVFLTVARMTGQKGHDVLLEAFRRLLDGEPGAALLLAGEGPERSRLERLAEELGIAGAVRFLGQRDDVPDLMAAADFLVLPSLFEGLPLVLLEAMAARLPVIATRAVGSLEATGAGHPFLAEAGDARSLLAAMRAALADRALGARATEALHRRFLGAFHADRMGAETRALYEETAARGAAPRRPQPMTRTRIGFIGAGGIADRHLGVLEGFADVELAAFADADFDRARDVAGRYGALAFPGHAAMLEAGGLDAVYVCVPPFAHGAIEHAVIAAGLPFFVEKPVALDLGLAREIERRAAAAGLVTAVGYHWRYLDTVEEARALFAENPVRLVSGTWLDATPPPRWWWSKAGSGGQMVEQTTHILDLARVLVGEVDSVFGLAGHVERADFPDLDVATASTASLRFGSGAVGTVASTCLLRWSHRVGLHLFADGLAVEMTDHDIMVDTGRGRPVRRAEGDPVEREDRDFIDAVQGRENRIRCPYGEAVRTLELALAIERSTATGQPVALSHPVETIREKAFA